MLTPLLLAMLAADGTVTAQAVPAPAFGGTVAPAALGAGTVAVYGQVGAPDLAVGYRQGFEALEVEARLSFNLFEVSGLLEGGVKFPLVRQGPFQLAVGGMLGLKANSGATYFDLANFPSWALRPAAIGTLSYELSEMVAAVAKAEVPVGLSLNIHGTQFTPTIALGAEIHVGQGVSLLVLGRVGADVREGPSGYVSSKVAWGVLLGVGYRVF